MPYLAISITEWGPIHAKYQSLPDTSLSTDISRSLHECLASLVSANLLLRCDQALRECALLLSAASPLPIIIFC